MAQQNVDVRAHNSDDRQMGLMLLCMRSLNTNIDDCYMHIATAGNAYDGLNKADCAVPDVAQQNKEA